jgi:uncharacterized protein
VKVQRYDRTFIEDYQKTPEGYLTVDAPIARSGVFPYRRGDQSVVMEAKLPEDIFSDATVSSARAKPVTDNHPNEPVTLANFSIYSKGLSHTDSRVENDMLKVSITVTDEDLIRKIESGQQKEISIGFLSDVVPEPGQYNGDDYQFVQRNIEINHIAVVERGRAGPQVSIRNDSDAWQIEDTGGNETMATYKIDGKDYEVDSAVKSHIDALNAKLDAAEVKVQNHDTLQGKFDALKIKSDGLEADLKKAEEQQLSEDQLDAAVEARTELIAGAKTYLGDDFEFKGKKEREIKEAVIQKVNPDFKGDSRSDDYVNAFYDATVAKAQKDGFPSTGPNSLHTGGGNFKGDAAEQIEQKRNSRMNLKK